MDRDCQTILRNLVEVAGGVDRLAVAEKQHLESCARCREAAAEERSLHRIFDSAVPPADSELMERVLCALPAARRRRRLLALLPVAASLLVALLGAVMLGGVPGSSLLAQLPVWSGQGWHALADGAADWAVALATTARAARWVLPVTVVATAAVMCGVGLVVVFASVRRWRALSPWQRGR